MRPEEKPLARSIRGFLPRSLRNVIQTISLTTASLNRSLLSPIPWPFRRVSKCSGKGLVKVTIGFAKGGEGGRFRQPLGNNNPNRLQERLG